MARQSFFVEGRYLGARQIESYRQVPGLEVRWHHSYAYFCPRCGDIWARILHEGAQYTEMRQRACAKHANRQFSLDGRLSDLDAWFDSPLRLEGDWPREALVYEFLNTLEWFEHNQKES